MTERSVVVGIAISVTGGNEHEFEIDANRYDEQLRSNVQGLGEEIIGIVVSKLDDRLAGEVPAGWKLFGTRETAGGDCRRGGKHQPAGIPGRSRTAAEAIG